MMSHILSISQYMQSQTYLTIHLNIFQLAVHSYIYEIRTYLSNYTQQNLIDFRSHEKMFIGLIISWEAMTVFLINTLWSYSDAGHG